MQSATATCWIEVGVVISATLTPAEPDVGIFSHGWEDETVEELRYKERDRQGKMVSVDLFEGVNMANPEVQKFLSNLLKAVGQEYAWETLNQELL